jgi:hypothetical protein
LTENVGGDVKPNNLMVGLLAGRFELLPRAPGVQAAQGRIWQKLGQVNSETNLVSNTRDSSVVRLETIDTVSQSSKMKFKMQAKMCYKYSNSG